MPYIDFQQLEQLDTAVTPASTSKVIWTSAGLSHIGCKPDLNEDAYFIGTEQELWAVADGMGGLARGDYASRVVVEALVHFSKSQNIATSIRDLEFRLRGAHDNCRGSFPGEQVGSTVAALLAYEQYIFFLWAGDSRVYRLRDGELKLLTTDHTLAQESCDRGELTPEQASRHPSAHILTRAVGVHQTLHLDLDYDTVRSGDRYLLCSDGLYNATDMDNLRSLLEQSSLERALDSLIDLALDRGGQDNITAVIAEAR